MPVEPNDPRWTALLLGELSDAERATLETQAAESPELAEAVDAARQTADTLRTELAAEPCPHLTPPQREVVLNEIAAAGSGGGATASGTWAALLGTFGWTTWGAWLALVAAGLLITAGVVAWNWGGGTPDQPVAGAPSPETNRTSADDPSTLGETLTHDPAVADDPDLIVLHVGETLPLHVLGQVGSSREVQLAADRLTWSTEPLAGFVEFHPQTLTVRALKPTQQPVLLTVRFGELAATVRIRVIENDVRLPRD